MVSALFPFQGRFLDRNGNRLHYIDEGAGPAVVMVHGNPSWSFYYRNLVTALAGSHRCIVPDHIGCGLSDKPDERRYDYSLQSRVDDLEALLESLQLRDFSLIVHDWGGMIGMACAVRRPDLVRRLVILNTAAFHLPAGRRLPFALWLGRNTALGTFLIRGLNLFCRRAATIGVQRRPLPTEVRAEYLRPYDSWAHRVAVSKFVQTIPLRAQDPGYDLVTDVENRLGLLCQKPMLIGWGMRDFVFDAHFLAEWTRRFPAAEVIRYADAGHYVLEDAAEELVPAIKSFLAHEAPSGDGL